MAPKVLHLSTYDANGGAGRAAYALHRAMLAQGIPSRMHVARKSTDDPTVSEGARLPFTLASRADRALWKLQRSPISTWRSPARFGSLTADQINRSDADIINLHWVTDGFLSIETIGNIEKPIVWTMYDMWPFTGTEHYCPDAPNARWRHGYTTNRPTNENGLELDRWAFERKVRHWRSCRKPFHMVPASTWLQEATRLSALMHDWPVTRIPHVVDTELFAPRDSADARAALGLPPDLPLLLFLSSAGIRDQRKGFDLLEQALHEVKRQCHSVQLVVVGPIEAGYESLSGVPVIWLNAVSDSDTLANAYAATDITVVPSREDNMPLTAMEAQTMGRAVVGFQIGGLPDIVEDGRTGLLAQPGDAGHLANNLLAALDPTNNVGMSEAATSRAKASWSPTVVVEQYVDLYQKALS